MTELKAVLRGFADKLTDADAERIIADDAHRSAVEAFVWNYKGTFSYLRELHWKFTGGQLRWSVGIYRGVLNCLRAEAVREAAAPAPVEPVGVAVPNGIYTVEYVDGSYLTVRLKAHWAAEEKANGVQVLQYLNGPANTSDYASAGTVRGDSLTVWRRTGEATAAGLVKAWATLIGDPLAAGESYALASGKCFRCNRTLTVPASLHRGLGPECVKHFAHLAA